MAKAKITNKGNVQVVMSQEQWDVVNSIFQHVRLGDRNAATQAFSDLCIDLNEFNTEYFDEYCQVETYVSIVTKRGNTKIIRDSSDSEFCIELDMVEGDEDDEDKEWD